LREEHKAILALLREMKPDARPAVTPLKPGVERVYLVAVGVPYRRNADPPAYKVLERALRPAIKSIGGKWIKTQRYEDYNPRTRKRV
jgi:hypothetical protein